MVRQAGGPRKLRRLSARHGAAPASDGWPGPTAEAAPAGSGIDTPVGIAEFGAILRRRWRSIAAVTIGFTLLGGAFAFLSKSEFTASTMIFVDPRNRASFQIEGGGNSGFFDPNLVDSQIVVIESDAVLQRVIAGEKLTEDSEFARGPGDAQANALRNLKEAVKVKRPDRTYVVEVQVRTESGAKSARIANAIAAAYLTDGRDTKNETAQREGSWLDTHLKNLQDRLKDADARVEAYKVQNRILGVEGRLVGEQQLSELNRGIVEAQRRASEAKATYDQVEQLRRSGRPTDTSVEALKSGVIERLRTQLTEVLRLEANARTTLGPQHPAYREIREQIVETRRQINEELARIAEGARSAWQVAQANVTSLEKQLDQLKRDATGMNQTLLRLRELERAVEAQKAVYEKFLRDKEQIARLTVDTPAGRVIAPAIPPERRSFPNRPLILVLAFTVGLFFGVALALVLETLAHARLGGLTAARTPSAVGGWPALPAEPARPAESLHARLPSRSRRSLFGRKHQGGPVAANAVLTAPDSDYAREIRRFAGDLVAGLPSGSTATFLITGAKAGESQPVLTVNLALALAEKGTNVLLIDGTGRPGGLKAHLPAERQPVQVELNGQPNLVEALPPIGPGALFFLPYGGLAVRRASARLPKRGACAIVLIDGPALGTPDLDRIDVEQVADGVIAVLPAGSDPAGALARALSQRFGPALVGLIEQAA